MLNEIRTHFSTLTVGMRPIKALPNAYPAFTFYDGYSYGVAIEYHGNNSISQRFANAQICTKSLMLGCTNKNFLILRSFRSSLYYEFATLCAQFVDPGENGTDRKNLHDNPANWWNNWKELLGNTITDRYSYSVLGEMLALDHLIMCGNKAEWRAVQAGSHDIETPCEDYEVKSTLKRYGATITISGHHQLKSTNPLFLLFSRMEKSSSGLCINDVVEQLVLHGYSRSVIEEELASVGYEQGTIERTQKYKVLEKRKYFVDSSFPKITESSFIGGKLPEGVLQVTYTIDLEALSYTSW